MGPPAKRAKVSPDSKSEIDCQLVLELAIERIGNVGTLLALSVVTKRLRAAVFSQNGIRDITCLRVEYSDANECNCDVNCTILNGIHIKSGAQIVDEQELKLLDGIRWIWKLAKKLRSIRILEFEDEEDHSLLKKVLLEFTTLSVVQPRIVDSVKLKAEITDSFLLPLIQENRRSLRKLCVFQTDSNFETQAFWKIVSQCSQLETLHFFPENAAFHSLEASDCLRSMPLKSVRFQSYVDPVGFCNAFSQETSRQSLQNLAFLSCFISPILSKLRRRKMSFKNVTELQFKFVCYMGRTGPTWKYLLSVFPALNKIRLLDYQEYWRYIPEGMNDPQVHAVMMSQKTTEFCQPVLTSLCDRSTPTDIDIEIIMVEEQDKIREQSEVFMNALKNADIKVDKIIMERCKNDLIQKVILQRGNAKLIFTLKPKKQKQH